jgi:hypothetical protein
VIRVVSKHRKQRIDFANLSLTEVAIPIFYFTLFDLDNKNKRLDLPLSKEIKEYFEKSTKTQLQGPCFREELKKLREQEPQESKNKVILLLS